jgi:LmbE family N-acetylglucosaminyl deacetylase
MIRRLVILCVLVVAAPAWAQQIFPPVTRDDRIMIVAPHPDDEVLGAGGLIQQAVAVGADVRVVYLTYGDHNQVAFKLYHGKLWLRAKQYLAYGEERRREATAATGMLGLPAEHLTFLGYPDWWTLRIWRDCWGTNQVLRSDATQATAVPYKDAFHYGNPYRGESIESDFVELIRKYRPTRLFVTHPADSNRDHRAAANFVRLAVLDVAREGCAPEIYYYIIHFGRWSRPFHYHPDLELEPPRQLLDDSDWMSLPLTPAQTAAKRNAILANASQMVIGEYFFLSLARANELFASIPVQIIPRVPADWALNWREAVRNKSIPVPPMPAEYHDGQAGMVTESLALEQTEFLLQGYDLIAQITLKNRLGKRTGVNLYLFGYDGGANFGSLPKLHVNISAFGRLAVFVNGQRVPNRGVHVESVASRFFVRVPLQLLGPVSPEYLFTATGAHLGEISTDDSAWQLFALTPEETTEWKP